MIKRFIRILEYIGGKKVYGIIVAVIIIMFLITSRKTSPYYLLSQDLFTFLPRRENHQQDSRRNTTG